MRADLPASLGVIAHHVAYQRHCIVMQSRYHDAPHLAGGARSAVAVDDFDQQALGLKVVMIVTGTLQGQIADFLRRIGVYDRNTPSVPAQCP